ncbi:SusD/RagB family nutrient-binding outer membrane lipoprotein [Sphingobacterium sp. SRCM116780]|uniref:SusD/RagB family nutrient-binding outer membrane lipoprotein n=1 Tax=Sphingobacterium sp. SRCM116780 TaxID=2907623 RepID=UPI001F491B42|nr:SusD/RagB family nutrient-binding outer membrane lipoprotein [Sphingobacterium sp. SRCM116780]UIR54750.1 SusD/RagB family nutrient-binding outer membrane lipoprotein [Sphingobacterium sp. SRCM116780]
MKTKTLKNIAYLGVGTFLLLGNTSCTKDFEKINTPPTSVTSVDPALLLSRVLRDGTFQESGEVPNNKFGSWVQHWAGGPVVPVSRYFEGPENLIWSQHFQLLRNIVQIKQELKGLENDPAGRSKLAIAEIYEVYLYQRLTDLFGDIPFSEITQSSTTINRTPKFDKQEDIYPALVQHLDAALAKLTAGDSSYGTADFFYGGSIDKWKKFGNSLKLRLGMRMRYANPSLAQQTVTTALSSEYGLLASNADNAAVATFNNAQAENQNPILRMFTTGSADLRYLANTLVNTLKTYDDPRLPLLAQPVTINGNTVYQGIGVALTDNELSQLIRANYSTPNKSTWFSLTAVAIPSYAMTYSDVCFYKAEAALLGWGATNSEAHTQFVNGVKAAFALPPYNLTSLPSTYEQQVLSFTGLTDAQKMEKIGTQKWIQLFGRNMEAFAEWRRTGYPVLTPGPNPGSTNGKIPRRGIYSSEEAELNEANYKEAVARLSNGDSFLSKVWWDKR